MKKRQAKIIKERPIHTVMESYTYPRTSVMVKKGVSTREIHKMKSSGELVAIKRGLYRVAKKTVSEYQDFVDVAQAAPGGVICLESGLAYHDLTTFNPTYVSVAVRKGSRIPVVDYPPTEFFIFSEAMFELGIETVKTGDFTFRIYDKEKTV